MTELYEYERNWKINKDKTLYRHKDNPKMTVAILPNVITDHRGCYIIIHHHPAKNRETILQSYEYAKDMAEARKKLIPHLKHWNDSSKWESDPDFGKAM